MLPVLFRCRGRRISHKAELPLTLLKPFGRLTVALFRLVPVGSLARSEDRKCDNCSGLHDLKFQDHVWLAWLRPSAIASYVLRRNLVSA
jgi:hypothetical protein